VPAGFGLSASDGVPEHDPGIVVVGVVLVVVVDTVVVVVDVPVDGATVSTYFVLFLPFTHA
jgi:hypothetical protein